MSRTLTQTQIIQSLAEALGWFEKELSWGVAPAELNHLTGRIGELYAAMITRGQMALETNQRGYDVVSADNERISVKTITSTVNVAFNPATFDQVDRVIVLRINVDEDSGVSIEELMDLPAGAARAAMRGNDARLTLKVARRQREPLSLDHLAITGRASFEGYRIMRYENGTIRVECGGAPVIPAKPVLRDIAARIGVDPFREHGTAKNTRQLGDEIIRAQNRES